MNKCLNPKTKLLEGEAPPLDKSRSEMSLRHRRGLPETHQGKLTMDKKIGGWNITQTNGYYKAFRRIKGKLIGVHLGKEWNKDWKLKIRRKEQMIEIERCEQIERAKKFKGKVFKSAPRRNDETLSAPMDWLVNNKEKANEVYL